MTTGTVHSPPAQRRHLAALFLAVVLLASVYPLLAGSSYRGSNDLHAALEVVGSMVGLVAGLSFVVYFTLLGDRAYLVIGLAFFVNGAEDLAHGLVSSRILQELLGTPASSLEQFIPGTYVAGRLLMAGLLLVAMLVPRQPPEGTDLGRQTLRVSLAVLGGTAVFTMLVFATPLPTFILPDRLISRPVDALSAVLFACAGAAFLREYRRTASALTWWILLSIGVNVVGQALMAFSSSLYDPFFDVAHAYKGLGYLIPVWAFALHQTVIIKERTRAEGALESRAGELQNLVASRTDELQVAYEALQEKEHELRLVLVASPVPMLILRASDGETLYANDAVCELAGVAPGDFKGRPLADFVADPAQRDAMLQALGEHGSVQDMELDIVAVGGRELTVLASMKMTVFDGEPAVLTGIVDITERKQAAHEKDLQRQRISSYNNAIMELAALQIDAVPDFEATARRVAETVTRTIGVDRLSVWLFSDDKTEIHCVDLFEHGAGTHSAGAVLKNEDFPAYFQALLEGRIMAADDAVTDPRTSAFTESYLVPNRITSMLDAAIRVEGDVRGVVCAEQQRVPRQWIEDEGLFVAAMADQLAAALVAGERQRAQDEAAAAAEEWRRFIDTANAPIFGVDLEGRIDEWNQKAAQITGYTAEEVLGHDLVADFITPELQDSVGGVVDAAFLGDETSNFEFPLFTKKGDRIELLLNATPRRNLGGDVIGMIGVGQDITDRVRVEQELEAERALLAARVEERTAELSEANSELAAASRAKDEFLASMSHELRTPLNALLATSESLQEGVYGDLTDRQSRSIALIADSGRHLLELINDILDLSKIEAGRFELVLDEFVVEDLCEASLRFVREAATLKNITVSRPSGLAEITMWGDARRVKQILVNLLSNAVKFTPEGGEVGLEVTADAEQEAIRFSVWDTGIGIEDKDQALLFKPFVQLDAGLDRHFEGTGLGLSLVARLTELHGGGVQIESEGRNRGSRFSVLLPWVERQPAASEETPSAAPDRQYGVAEEGVLTASREQRPTILMAEDNDANIAATRDYLEAKGFQLVVARDGVAAVQMTRELHPDLILMDIQMPRLDGLEATRQIRQEAQFERLPIIALTALAMRGDRERCLAAGADEYLSKPVKLAVLLETIDRLLDARPPAAEST